ncbi:hypothetical protein K9O30_21440 [Clostridium bowmanii]|uniref:YncE family protein n=1 Tax=Clostridium bowmanii TaxID=132925 RepID=UPI001C0B4931|nr:hypothetical protein [Clostridium bowmanii]MBU3192054.1 hypothetical protein [Clostridium bowmanii]MCA1076237.1 hypothetical protein [Clostridium bowmanii]
MIKIDENITRNYYIVSNLNTGTLTIVDSLCNMILKEIEVGRSPYNLVLKDNNTVAVACNISNTISFVNCISGEIKQNYIPNNGNLQIDKTNKKTFVSNTFEINIYDINLEKLLGNIGGFSAIIDLKLNRDGSKLYVLDTLLKELRIYSNDNYKLINSFRDLGMNPRCFLISDDDKFAYISIGSNILKIDIISKKLMVLNLPKGSLIAGMILKDRILYASNQGLNRIELINIDNNIAYDFIMTSTLEPTKLLITEDNTKILVTNRGRDGYGTIDIVDLKYNIIIATIYMKKYNSQPYDVISLSLPYTYIPPVAITNLQQINKGITIIAKKVFASYNENVNFPIININLPKDLNSIYTFENIIFKPGIIVNNSQYRNKLSTTSGFSSIKFIARVNYIIDYVKNHKKESINGFFEKPIELFLDIPKDRELEEFEINIKTITKIIGTPEIADNVIRFGVFSRMELKIIGEDEIYINSLKENYDNEGEDFEAFDGFGGSIFVDETIFPL